MTPAPDFLQQRESLNDEITDFIQQQTPGCNQGSTEAKPQRESESKYPMNINFINTPGFKSGLVFVSPELATRLLGKQGKNRKLAQRIVKRYAAGFDGRTVIYQPIILDSSGRLLDGQHRLQAIILSGKSIKVWFITGVID